MPFPQTSQLPPYELSIGPRGEHFVTFSDHDPTNTARVTLEADMIMRVAFEMSDETAHVDTYWAKRHLRRLGYRIKEPRTGMFS